MKNLHYLEHQTIKFFNGFKAIFEAKVKKVNFDNKIKQYHYELYDVKLIKKSSIDFDGSNDFNNTCLHSHVLQYNQYH